MSYSDQPPPPPPQYGAPSPYGGGAQPQKNSVMAIIGLVTGIIGVIPFCCLGTFVFSIAATILGFLGQKEIRESNGAKKGAGMAKAAWILGIVGIALGVILWIVVLATGSFEGSYYSDM